MTVLLVLDEPNANLDADGENALTRAIGIMRQNKSIVVVISHRPSALSALDMTMVLYEARRSRSVRAQKYSRGSATRAARGRRERRSRRRRSRQNRAHHLPRVFHHEGF